MRNKNTKTRYEYSVLGRLRCQANEPLVKNPPLKTDPGPSCLMFVKLYHM